MEIGLMVEGQNGLTWERWIHILKLAEQLGFPTVFRSDHYFIGPQQDSLEAYLSFAVAARETSSIRFGPLVSPVTFRSPVDVGRMAAQIDQLSAGRFVMGMGAGWNEAEHRAYGIPFPPVKERFDRLEEAIQVVRALWAPGPASFEGKHYRLEGADCQPKPTAGGPPLLIGGSGEKRTLKLVARYADEWNAVNVAPEGYAGKVEVLKRHCEAEGRDPAVDDDVRGDRAGRALPGPRDGADDGDVGRTGRDEARRLPPGVARPRDDGWGEGRGGAGAREVRRAGAPGGAIPALQLR
ncbi:MAG: TIGR03560 family F420-dependent LLM class oxidoreductase [Dehalococcoidia bacterium]|nr:TIGR03560 family F420-dependent LLM class oxidoreductase [Dehalococcoidia bacterium]